MVSLSHRGICVSDLDASARFYREALGFVDHQDYGVVSGPDMDRTMQLSDVRLRATMLYCTDPGAMATKPAERGGYFIEDAHVRTPTIELLQGADPDGVRIELMRAYN